MYKRILVATDGSAPAQRALEKGIELTLHLNGELTIVHVIDLGVPDVAEFSIVDKERLAEMQAAGAEVLAAARAKVPAGLRATSLLMHGDPAETILTFARDSEADMILMGSDSRGRLSHFLLGSTADSVIRRAHCPVMTVRREPHQRCSTIC